MQRDIMAEELIHKCVRPNYHINKTDSVIHTATPTKIHIHMFYYNSVKYICTP